MKSRAAKTLGLLVIVGLCAGLECWQAAPAQAAKADAANRQYHQAVALFGEGNYDGAAQALLSIKPDHQGALYSLGYLLDVQGDSHQAREMLSRLVKVNQTHADGWYLLGRIAERDNKLPEASEAYRMAIAAKPELVDAHYNLAFVYRSEEKEEQAAREFLEVLRLKPEYAEAHMNLGLVYTGLSKLDEAERQYEAAINLKPDMAEAHYNLGLFYELHKKDPIKALVQYRKYLELGGKDERVERIVGQAGKWSRQ